MIKSIYSQKIYPFLLRAYVWYLRTPERSLDEAYQTALQIQAVENEHFNGNKISPDTSRYSSSVMDYFRSDLKKQLKNIRMRLTEFKACRFFLNESHQKEALRLGIELPNSSLILEKLQVIDQVIVKYKVSDDYEVTSQEIVTTKDTPIIVESTAIQQKSPNPVSKKIVNKSQSKAQTTGIIPRSIFSTISRIQIELDPNGEQNVVQNFRDSKRRTLGAVRFILLLIIVPLLTHQLSKNFVVGPIVNHFKGSEEAAIFLNFEMEEEALEDLGKFEERIKFENLIGTVALSAENIEAQMQDKASEIAEEYRNLGANAIKNIFADMFAVAAFSSLLLVSKREIAMLKSFIDKIVYGLSDSAKAFIIILCTDIFVGFHSPHGWEVILEGVSRHWGLPASHDFIFLFIATFPVILDTIFKYWIFRFLNRISPSAVATYRNMNE